MKFINRKPPRGMFQREFIKWLAETEHSFSFPLRIIRRTERGIEMKLLGVNSAIWISLRSTEINVGVTWQGKFLDFLVSNDCVAPQHTSSGYICKYCENEERKTYSSRENLWRDHLFEPFLDWVNNELANAEFIGIYGSIESGATWAKLVQELRPQEGGMALIPIRTNPNHRNPDSDVITYG